MPLPNIFSETISNNVINRIEQLNPESKATWGKMNVSQMLAHCSVTYEMIYEPEKHKAPNALAKFFLKLFVKPKVVSENPYPKSSPTAPAFIIKDNKDFENEKERLIGFIIKTQKEGAQAFEGRASVSFGNLNSNEWNNMFYKHLDHHLNQFGV
jgi:hypothetical protein